MRSVAPVLPIAALLALAACAPRSGDALSEAASAYRSTEYGRAATAAHCAGESATGTARDRANYLEALALLRLGRIDDAAPLLFSASGSTDPEIAGDARISLGTAEIRRGDYESAGRAYRRASQVLAGDDARRASEIAERCFARARAANPFVAVETHPNGVPNGRVAPQAEVEPDPPEPIETRVRPGTPNPMAPAIPAASQRFAIQAGAFSDEPRADDVARALAARVAGLGIGRPRVFAKRRADGTVVHVVQVGEFPDRVSADRILRSFSKDGFTVERAGP